MTKTTIPAYTTTYDPAKAQRALAALNASRQRFGIAPAHIRAFQKSIADGNGDLFIITTHDGRVEDVIRLYDAVF